MSAATQVKAVSIEITRLVVGGRMGPFNARRDGGDTERSRVYGYCSMGRIEESDYSSVAELQGGLFFKIIIITIY